MRIPELLRKMTWALLSVATLVLCNTSMHFVIDVLADNRQDERY